eukprot:PDM84174.1 hypothetical protein PRIPAC_35150 [Pristionchus pacificus]
MVDLPSNDVACCTELLILREEDTQRIKIKDHSVGYISSTRSTDRQFFPSNTVPFEKAAEFGAIRSDDSYFVYTSISNKREKGRVHTAFTEFTPI